MSDTCPPSRWRHCWRRPATGWFPGSPAWTSLPDTDPTKLRACLAAALWWALDAEHRQAGEVEASHAVSAPVTGEARWTFTAGVSTGRTITTSARPPIWSRRAWRADRRVPGAGEPLTAANCKRASNCAVRVGISLLQVSDHSSPAPGVAVTLWAMRCDALARRGHKASVASSMAASAFSGVWQSGHRYPTTTPCLKVAFHSSVTKAAGFRHRRPQRSHRITIAVMRRPARRRPSLLRLAGVGPRR